MIFGNQQATGMFAKGTNDPLACDASESALDSYSIAWLLGTLPVLPHFMVLKVAIEVLNVTEQSSGRERGRASVGEEDPVISSVTSAFNNLANAIMMTAPRAPPMVLSILWDVMEDIPAFDEGDPLTLLHISCLESFHC